jgi:hypothetical protein
MAKGAVFAVLIAANAIAQTTTTMARPVTQPVMVSTGGAFGGAIGFEGSPLSPLNQVAGQPYSAQQETQTVQTLADGTHITNGTQKVMYYRDSQGRTRTERTAMTPPGFLSASSAAPPVFIEITDPVAGYRYSFDSNSHTVHRMPIGPMPFASRKVIALAPLPSPPPLPSQLTAVMVSTAGAAVIPAANEQRPQPNTTTEQLGTQTIEGVLAEGVRRTTIYPVGFVGNDRPVTAVSENWTSRELGMAVLTKNADPRSGETTMRLTNISRTEPDASLFQPPAGSEVVDPVEK